MILEALWFAYMACGLWFDTMIDSIYIYGNQCILFCMSHRQGTMIVTFSPHNNVSLLHRFAEQMESYLKSNAYVCHA